jgi:hypothetical protein
VSHRVVGKSKIKISMVNKSDVAEANSEQFVGEKIEGQGGNRNGKKNSKKSSKKLAKFEHGVAKPRTIDKNIFSSRSNRKKLIQKIYSENQHLLTSIKSKVLSPENARRAPARIHGEKSPENMMLTCCSCSLDKSNPRLPRKSLPALTAEKPTGHPLQKSNPFSNCSIDDLISMQRLAPKPNKSHTSFKALHRPHPSKHISPQNSEKLVPGQKNSKNNSSRHLKSSGKKLKPSESQKSQKKSENLKCFHSHSKSLKIEMVCLNPKDSLSKLPEYKPQILPLDHPTLEYQFSNFKDSFLGREKDYQERGLATIAAKGAQPGYSLRTSLQNGLTEPSKMWGIGLAGKTDIGNSYNFGEGSVDRGLGEGSFGGQRYGGCVSGCIVKCFDCGSPLGGREGKEIEVLIKQKLEQLSKITVSRRSSSERGGELSVGNRSFNGGGKGKG